MAAATVAVVRPNTGSPLLSGGLLLQAYPELLEGLPRQGAEGASSGAASHGETVSNALGRCVAAADGDVRAPVLQNFQ
jgi:hypothetical protein